MPFGCSVIDPEIVFVRVGLHRMIAAVDPVCLRVQAKEPVKDLHSSQGMFQGEGMNLTPLPLFAVSTVSGAERIHRRTYASGNYCLNCLLFRGIDIVHPLIRAFLHQAVDIEIVLSSQRSPVEFIELISQKLAGHFYPYELKKGRCNLRGIHVVIPSLQLFNYGFLCFIRILHCLSSPEDQRG